MKRFFSIISIVALVAALTGCKKADAPSMSILQENYEIGFSGETTSIGVLCNRAWTATPNVSWISLTPSQAEAFEAKSYMLMTVEPNDNGEPRTGIVTIATNGGEISKTVTVLQKANGEIIVTADQFIEYLNKVNEGTASDGFRLGADIDLSGKTLPAVPSMAYKLDGCQHSIKNWITSGPLFGEIAVSGEVKNLNIDQSCKLTANTTEQYFGFIATKNNGKLSHIYNSAPVELKSFGKTDFGVICGQNNAIMENCTNDVDIVYTGAAHTGGSAYIAGIVGQNTGASAYVKNLINTGNITLNYSGALSQSIYCAGIVGTNNSNAKVLGCYNKGNITVKCPGCTTNGQASGIVCYSGGEVADCSNEGNISFFSESAEGKADGQVKGTGVAGIACYQGWANGKMTNCQNKGDITLRAGYSIGYQTVGSATKYATNVGGLVAHAYNCAVENCNNYGKVTSEIKAIDLCPAEAFQTTARHAIGGIVASSWGDIKDCINEGAVTATWITQAHNAALSKNFVMMAGGITGGSYNGGLTTSSQIVNCENKAAVYITCDSSGSNNNVGGIVGWSSNEAANTAVIENCKNSGEVTHDGYGKVRFGGIAGAGSTLKGCENTGKVYLKSSTTNSCVGGVIGWFNFNGVVNCTNKGDVKSDVNITNALAASGANYSSQSGIGGIVGGHGNTDVTFTGNAVNCNVTAPAGCKFASMIFGMTDRDKTAAAGKTLNVGTADAPIKVKGSFGTIALTESNYTDYVKYTGFLNLNTAVKYNTVFGE